MSEERLSFQTEASKLLHLVVNSLYSEKQIFLRELISNASDACDRLRYAALTEPDLVAGDPDLRVRIGIDKKSRTIEVTDNGIGMNRDDLVRELGTIARSGTLAFLDELTGDTKKDMALIGQFGVGFYSAFIVADRIEVLSRKAGEDQAWLWASTGSDDFTVAEAARPGRGTTVVLHLRKDAKEFLDADRLRGIVRIYSDHIALPIVLADGETDETVNQASALWARPRNDITADQYKEFYHHVGHALDEPWMTLHYKAEGRIEYAALLFVPTAKPFDLFDPSRRHRVKLYVKRVYITDDCEALVPSYLRFLRGLVDSEDLPLNVSREMLQESPMVARIRAGVVKRVLGELGKKAAKEPDEYGSFWDSFGAVLKEGIYEDAAHRDKLLELARFHATAAESRVSLADYVDGMGENQEAIFYISGDDAAALRKSPHLEGFRARGIDVLLLTDPVDEFWIPAVGAYKEKPFRSVTRAGADLDKIPLAEEGGAADEDEKEAGDAHADTLVALFKLALKEDVKDVRVSKRLTDSAVCLVADEGDLDMHLEHLLKQHGQIETASKRILEVNPGHPLIRRLAEIAGKKGAEASLDDAAYLLLDQARILEGMSLPDPTAFSRRLSQALEKGFAA